MKIKFEIISDVSSLKPLETGWKHLAQNAKLGPLGAAFDVVNSIWRAMSLVDDREFGFAKKLVILAGFDNHDLVMILPLVLVKRSRGIAGLTLQYTCLQFVSQCTERQLRLVNNILIRPGYEHLWNEGLQYLYKNLQFDLLHLDHIPAVNDVCIADPGELFYSTIGSVAKLDRFGSYENYASCVYSQNLRQKLRTAFNFASRQEANVAVEISHCHDQAKANIDKNCRRKLMGEQFITDKYFSLLTASAITHRAMVSQVFVNDAVAGYGFWVANSLGVWLWDSYIDIGYKQFQLGAIMRDSMIKESFARHRTFVGLGLWAPLHEYQFANELMLCYKLLRPGNTIKSSVAYALASYLLRKRSSETGRLFNKLIERRQRQLRKRMSESQRINTLVSSWYKPSQ